MYSGNLFVLIILAHEGGSYGREDGNPTVLSPEDCYRLENEDNHRSFEA